MALHRVRFPIAAKLVLTVSIFLLVALGGITALASALVSSDVRLTAEDHNFTVNRWSARAAEGALKILRSQALLLLEDPGQDGAFFFSQHPDIAAVAVPEEDFSLVNQEFFTGRDLDPETVRRWLAETDQERVLTLRRVRAGETFFRGASPLLVMLFPRQDAAAAAVFFSPENLLRGLGQGDNRSFFLNEKGELLAASGTGEGGEKEEKGEKVLPLPANLEGRFQTIYTDRRGTEFFAAFERLPLGNAVVVTRIPTEKVFAGVREAIRRNLLSSAAVFVLSILGTVLYSRTLSRPLKALTRAAARIEAGDYRLGLCARGRDEIGSLTRSFIGMGHGVENFERFTNKTIVRLARQGKLTRAGTGRTVTVCFALIRDFSALAARMDAHDTVAFVNSFLGRIVPCITGSGGVVDKFLTQDGVVVMALWGAPESAGSPAADARSCLKAAFLMRGAMREWNRERAAYRGRRAGDAGWARPVKLGCGINSGPVVAGQIGSEERMEYTVIGDAVNLAARLEGPNDLFDTDILITEATCRLAGAALLSQQMPSLEVKGKTRPVKVFAAVNFTGASGPQTLQAVRAFWAG